MVVLFAMTFSAQALPHGGDDHKTDNKAISAPGGDKTDTNANAAAADGGDAKKTDTKANAAADGGDCKNTDTKANAAAADGGDAKKTDTKASAADGGDAKKTDTKASAADGGDKKEFGSCTPTMDFQLGRGNRKATEGTFLPTDEKVAQGQQDALNPNIITNRICDQLTNVCGATEDGKKKCLDAKAQVLAAQSKDKSMADLFNKALGF